MIIVTVKKIDAITGARTTLHTVEIVNDGSGNSSVGNYEASWRTHGQAELVNARVEGHRRADGALWLVRHAIEAVVLAKEGKL